MSQTLIYGKLGRWPTISLYHSVIYDRIKSSLVIILYLYGAEDDKVNKLTMSFIFPAELVDEDQAEMMEAGYKTLEETGIKVSSDKTDEEFTIKMEIPIEEKTLEALKDLDLDLDSTDFSFKAMKQELLDDGFTEKK